MVVSTQSQHQVERPPALLHGPTWRPSWLCQLNSQGKPEETNGGALGLSRERGQCNPKAPQGSCLTATECSGNHVATTVPIAAKASQEWSECLEKDTFSNNA